MNQDVKKCMVTMRGKLKWILTQRPLMKIVQGIKRKLYQKLEQDIGKRFSAEIHDAVQPGGEIGNQINEMIEN